VKALGVEMTEMGAQSGCYVPFTPLTYNHMHDFQWPPPLHVLAREAAASTLNPL